MGMPSLEEVSGLVRQNIYRGVTNKGQEDRELLVQWQGHTADDLHDMTEFEFLRASGKITRFIADPTPTEIPNQKHKNQNNIIIVSNPSKSDVEVGQQQQQATQVNQNLNDHISRVTEKKEEVENCGENLANLPSGLMAVFGACRLRAISII